MISSTKSLVLSHIWNNPGTHRKEIASHFGLHPNLVSDAVKSLIKERWVKEGESKKTSVGRSPIALYLDPKNHAAISVSYLSDSMTCGLVNANGDILHSKTVTHDLRNPDAIVDLAVQQIAAVRKEYRGIIIGLAVADPGMIDQRKGEVIRSSTFPGWRHIPIAKLFNKKTRLEVVVADATQARAMAQYRILPDRRHALDSILYLDYGAGIIGFAFLTQDGIWRGEGFAGEVGHVVIDQKGSICRCGARGCLESLTASRTLESRAKTFLEKGINSVLRKKDNISAADIFHAARGGDRFARTIVHDIIADLGLYVAILVAMLHPRLLVVGAESEDAISLVTAEIRQEIHKRLPLEIASTVTVTEGKPINPLSLVGAGLMLFEQAIQLKEGSDK